MRLAVVMLVALATPLAAQSIEDRLRDQLRLTTTQLHDLQSNQASLEASKAAAEKELAALKGKPVKPADDAALATARASAAAAGDRAAKAEAAAAAAGGRADAAQAELSAARTEIAQLRRSASASSAAAATSAASLQVCTDRNAHLVATGNALVAAWQQRLGNAHYRPWQIARTEWDNALQAYGDQIYANRADAKVVNPPTPPQAATKPQ
jgi:chromosome segregation ATPase